MNAAKIIGLILVLGLIAGAIYLFSKSSNKENKEVSTTTTTTENSGLSGVLSGLNLSGLSIMGL